MRSEEEMIAYALEISPRLLPYVPELLADFEELGSDVEEIVEVISALDLPDSASVIDLGCGKGAVSVAIAVELGLTVLGIDLFEPFILSCQNLAAQKAVSDLCTFQQGDISKLSFQTEPADVVIFAALGDVLGPLDETIGIIRRYVKPGGFIVVNDDFTRQDISSGLQGFEGYVDHQEAVRRLLSWGDTLTHEVIIAVEDGPDEESERIRQRALQVAQQHPEIEADLLAFVEDQMAANSFIKENLMEAIWVLQRTADA